MEIAGWRVEGVQVAGCGEWRLQGGDCRVESSEGGRWRVEGGWWMVDGGWWMVDGGEWMVEGFGLVGGVDGLDAPRQVFEVLLVLAHEPCGSGLMVEGLLLSERLLLIVTRGLARPCT